VSEVQLVWTGPSSAAVPVRSMAAVLEDLIAEAKSELVIMTYSARPYPPVRAALAAALQRQVRVDVVVETLTGAGSALSGSEPAAAFAGLPGLTLWHRPKSARGTESAKMHAKVAIADGQSMLVSSANLTQSGVHDSLEAGVLIRGGTAPQRALEYVRDLQTRRVLTQLSTTASEIPRWH
jgi:phosphatidylserine/phosphatidylglycerophosphate/cardiolipin synthase-like enzyme